MGPRVVVAAAALRFELVAVCASRAWSARIVAPLVVGQIALGLLGRRLADVGGRPPHGAALDAFEGHGRVGPSRQDHVLDVPGGSGELVHRRRHPVAVDLELELLGHLFVELVRVVRVHRVVVAVSVGFAQRRRPELLIFVTRLATWRSRVS